MSKQRYKDTEGGKESEKDTGYHVAKERQWRVLRTPLAEGSSQNRLIRHAPEKGARESIATDRWPKEAEKTRRWNTLYV